MERTTNGNHQTLIFDSMDDLLAHVPKGIEAATTQGRDRHLRPDNTQDGWAGGSVADAIELGTYGWADGLTDAMPLAEDALELVDADIETIELTPEWDVTGGAVDIGRYVQGIPENMVEYTLTPVSNAGRVITLVASSSYSGVLDKQSVMRRGAAIVALALALERTGHELELWSDITVTKPGKKGTVRVLVKGVNDVVDPERIAYAYAHPTFLRRLIFSVQHLFDMEWIYTLGIGQGYGMPTNPEEDMPEGTIYLPSLRSAHDVPQADRFIIDTLAELGLTKEYA